VYQCSFDLIRTADEVLARVDGTAGLKRVADEGASRFRFQLWDWTKYQEAAAVSAQGQ
jgi:hypothetical protein